MVSIEMGSSLAHDDKLTAIRVRATVGNLDHTRSVMHKTLGIHFVLLESRSAFSIFVGKEECKGQTNERLKIR